MLINLSKEELKKIKYYLITETDPKGRFTDPLVLSIFDKIRDLDNVCDCQENKNENESTN